MSTVQSETQSRLERFASLRWYSSSVTFLFSFLAIVVSLGVNAETGEIVRAFNLRKDA